jgi:hypothetical protein
MRTPDDWENYCHQLCRLRHGAQNYQQVPDHDRGDLGIESYAVDGKGCVYQFYVAEAQDTAGRLRAQQRKMTTDLAKLEKNDKELVLLIGFKIKRWILLVPEYDSKRIVLHATKKAEEVVAKGLECVDNSDFRVLVQDDDAFAAEREALLRSDVAEASIDVDVPDSDAIEQWALDNASEVEVLDEKLRRLLWQEKADDRLAKLRRELLDNHLFGQNYAEQLSVRYPELYERFTHEKQKEEDDLVLRSMTTADQPREHLKEVRELYEQRLSAKVPGLDQDDVRRLAWAGVAEWMIRCPLDFPKQVT